MIAIPSQALVADIFGTSNVSQPPDDADIWYDFERNIGGIKELIRVRKKLADLDTAFVYTKARQQNSVNEVTPRLDGNTKDSQSYRLETEAIFSCSDFEAVRCLLKQ